MRLAILTVFLVGAPAFADVPTRILESSRATIDCYEHAANGTKLDRREAIGVCIAATSAVPARCADHAIGTLDFSDTLAIRLCRVARSNAPTTCATRLSGLGLEDRIVVGHCGAMRFPLLTPATRGNPQCISTGLAETSLARRDVERLCRGALSTAPIDCFAEGKDRTTLGRDDLIDLCAPVMVSAPIAIR